MITFDVVKRLTILLLIAAACGDNKEASNIRPMGREPVSVRGWITDVEGSASSDYKTVETEAARRLYLFQNTNVYVENAPFVSGGVAETGAFMLLDVPPGNVTITFQAPGAELATLQLQNIPGNADVFIPGLILKKDGVEVADAGRLVLRIPSSEQTARRTTRTGVVAGHQIPIVETPLNAMSDRHNYPDAPPLGQLPAATVK
jgi:hypothetical protein